jgi:hypothetical protein
MAATLPQPIHATFSSLWHSRVSSLSMSSRKETCRASSVPDWLPQNTPETMNTLPLTSTEWSNIITDVKTEFLHRRYRSCATRCGEILNNLQDSVSFLAAVVMKYSLTFHRVSLSQPISFTFIFMPPTHSRCSLVHLTKASQHALHSFTRLAITTNARRLSSMPQIRLSVRLCYEGHLELR